MKTYYFKEDKTLIDISTIPYEKYEWEREKKARKEAHKTVMAKDEEEAFFIIEHPEHEDVVSIRCYNDTDYMKRESAMEFYKKAMSCSEGSEQSRYTSIYVKLGLGYKNITDN